MQAAGVRLLQVRTGVVRTSVVAQSAPRTGVDAATLQVDVQFGSEEQSLMLRVNHSLGEWAARQQPVSVAFEGYLPNLPGSWVRVTRTGTRWAGIWFDGVNYFGIDSAGAVAATNAQAAAADPLSLVVFRLADAVIDGPVLIDEMVRPTFDSESLAKMVSAELQAPATAAVLSPMRRLMVGLIADAELVALDGASASSNMLERLNIVDGIFASQVGVRIQAENPTLLDATIQPFSGTRAGDLLDQLSVYRNATMLQRGTGLSHLMTGRDLDGQTVGIAFLSDVANGVALCSNRYSASVSEARRFVSYDGLIAAHEIGHVFGAPHDGETDPAADQSCAAEPPTSLMGATITNSRTLSFSNCSLEQMAPIIEIAKLQCLAVFDTDLSVVASFDAANVVVGSDTAATLTVRNLGNIAVTDAQLSVTVPAGLSVTAVTATGIDCALNGAAVSCTPSALAVNATATVRLSLRGAAAGIATLATNVSSSLSDPQTGNNQAQASITVSSATPPTPPVTSSPKSGGGKAGVELLLALLLVAQRLQGRRRQPAAVAK